MNEDRLKRVLIANTVGPDCYIHPSVVTQNHISERGGGSYPVKKVIELFENAADLGFGDIVVHKTPLKRKGEEVQEKGTQRLFR